MEHFRCNIIRILTAIVMMVVFVHGGMFECILNAQTSSITNIEDVLHNSKVACEDTENDSNDDCCFRRARKFFNSTTPLHFVISNLLFSAKGRTSVTYLAHIAHFAKTRHFSTLYCTFRI